MESKLSFDPERMAMLADDLNRQIQVVKGLRTKRDDADRELREAETSLSIVRREFTQAIDGQLDMDALKQKPIERHRVETP